MRWNLVVLVLLPVITRLKRRFNIILESILNYNLYQTTSTEEANVHEERMYTRVYVIVFTSCLTLLLFYTAVKEQTITKTYAQPSFMDYEHLRNLYFDDISCPCTRISIPYKEFVTTLRVDTFHQACSTSVIRFTLIGGNDALSHSTSNICPKERMKIGSLTESVYFEHISLEETLCILQFNHMIEKSFVDLVLSSREPKS
jgi:hypothetical protein